MARVAAGGERGLQLRRLRKSLRGEKRSGEEGSDGCACTHPPRVLPVLDSMRLWDEPISINIGRLLDTRAEGADGNIETGEEEKEAAVAVAAAAGEEEEIGIVGC